ncbi:SDR family oxidoreductase [Nocardia vinacea]|uniref:3-oxoacyl-[acyl-carrier-protein] reductase MabA n=1 Tax=Nocardia vinacea TaxID=96468 RepID=A0ABZ1YX87_9NOCA|nr:SDR family oxidoreductase [Nocardia vinacea]
MELGLGGRVAIVTGGSRGIGRACVEALAAEGASVCAVGRDEDLLAEVGRTPGADVVGIAADLTTEQGCDRAVGRCLEAFERVDILVNCAGAAGAGNVLELSTADIDSALLLKFHGYLRMAQRVAPYMAAAGWGRIVNIAGAAGTSPTADNLPTSLANIAVHNLTRSLSDELAPFGVLVNLICPGLTLTDRARTLCGPLAKAQGREVDDVLAEAAAGVPAGRAANPDEVARVAAFLSSDACSYMHGSAIYLDGGARRATP